MQESATGLILRTRPLTETSLIVHWLTPELGRLATVAKGARRPKSSFRGKLDLFYFADFSFTRSKRSDLHTLCEITLRETYPALRQELALLQQASYCTALIEQVTETETPLPEIFKLFRSLLNSLSQAAPRALTIFAFELKLLRELGLAPAAESANLSAGAREILKCSLALDWPELQRLKPSARQTTELRQFLHGFLIYHLGKIPRGRTAAASL